MCVCLETFGGLNTDPEPVQEGWDKLQKLDHCDVAASVRQTIPLKSVFEMEGKLKYAGNMKQQKSEVLSVLREIYRPFSQESFGHEIAAKHRCY